MLKDLKWTSCLSYVPLLAAALGMFPFAAHANPTGGTVTTGQATISEAGTKLTVNQQSDKAVIDWRGFNVAAGEWTQFNQPSSSSIALNRVNSTSASQINGKVTANGNIIIINQNGVVFGAGSQVDVNGLIATTADVGNDSFMNSTGKITFDKAGNADASVINNGTITAADAGLVGLVAPNVINNGTITAKLGKVQLASGDTATVDMYGDSLMEVAVSDNVKSQLVSNTGKINAAGGKIALTAAAGKNIVNSLITVKGELKAPAVSQKNGEIYIFAAGSNAVKGNVATAKNVQTGSSTVLVSAVIDVSGKNTGEHGGKISLLGDNVSLLSGTILDASGDIGGGTIKVGGDFHGGGDTATALNTTVQSGTTINADALTSGNGGNVAIWSDGYTQFAGAISARGGVNAGDGGYVETSGKGTLTFRGTVDTLAPNGQDGMLLLDPTTITIANGTADSAADGTGTFNGSGTAGTIASGDSLATIYESELEGIASTTNIYLQATNGITIQSLTTDHNLNLAQTAGHSVTFNAGSGAFTMSGGSADTITTAGGALSIITGGGASTIGNLTTGSGAITFNLAGTGTASGIISTSGGVTMSGAGNLTLSGNNTFTGGLNILSGTVTGTTSANAFGAGTITLGDSSGSNNATLSGNSTLTFANAIALGSTTGALTIASASGGTPTFSGGITGNNSFVLNDQSNSFTGLNISGAVNNVGTITNASTGGNISSISISGNIGSNVTGVIQNSAIGQLALSGNNSFNGLTIKYGQVDGSTSANVFGNGTITIGDSAGGSNNATLRSDYAGTIANTIVLASTTTGTLTIMGNANPGTTFSGGVTGNNNLTLNDIFNATSLNFTTNAINNVGTITNVSTGGVSSVNISANIGSNVTGVIDNSSASTLTLSGNNAFNGLTIKSGKVVGNTSANAFGTGSITIGDTSGSANATLQAGSATNFANAIVLNSGNTGTATIGDSGNFAATFSGGVTGTHDLSINNTGNSTLTFATASLNNTGIITNASSGSGGVTVSGGVGSSVTGITESSATSALTVSGGLAVNSSGTTLIDSSGAAALTVSGGVSGTGNLIVDNNSATANGVAFSTNSINNTGTITNAGTGSGGETISVAIGSNVTGITESSATSALTVSGGLAVNSSGTTLIDSSGAAALTVSGGVTGTGNLTVDNNSATANGITFSTNSINNTGTVTNAGTGAGAETIGVVIGSNVTGVTENSATSALYLTGANTYTGTTNINNGILNFTNGALGSSGNITFAGGTLQYAAGNTQDISAKLKNSTAGAITIDTVNNNVTYASVIDNSNTAGLTLKSTGTGILYLTGANTFTGGLNIKSGTVSGKGSDSAFGGGGTGNITLGDTSGSNNATLQVRGNNTFANNIILQSGTTGTLTILHTGEYGNITFSGAVTSNGNQNVTLNMLVASSSVTTFSGGFNNSGTITNISAGSNSPVKISGVIGSNVTGVTQNSATSILTLSGTNTFSGPLNILNGTVRAYQNASAFGTGTIYLGANGGNNSASLMANVGDNTYNNAIVLGSTAGALKIGYDGNTANTIAFTGGVTGNNSFTITSNNQWTNTTFSGGALNNAGTITNTSSNPVTISSNIGPLVTGLTQNSTGTGTLTLSGTNTYAGPTTITAGTLKLGVANALGGAATTNALVINGGTLDMNGKALAVGSLTGTGGSITSNAAGTFALNVGYDNTSPAAYQGTILQGSATSFSLNKVGTGTLTLSGTNTYTGGTTFTNGILNFTSGSLGTTGNLTFAGGTLQYASGNTQDISSSLKSSTAGAITIDTVNNNVTFANVVDNSNTGGLTLNSTGTGTLTLGNANTFTGGLTIKSGTVIGGAGSANAFGAGSITLGNTSGSANATLLGSGFTYTNAIALNSGNTGTLTIGNNNTYDSPNFAGAISGSNNLTINNTSPSGSNITLSGGVNNTGTITNASTGTNASVTISGIIGTNVTGVVENSANAALTLSGNNTFTTGTTIKSGTLIGITSANAFGTGTITLGDTSGSASATLQGDLRTFANAIVLNSGNTGALTIGTTGGGTTTYSGGITGNNNVLLNYSSGAVTLSGANIDNTGTITNIATSAGAVTISSVITNKVTGVYENSATSNLVLSGNNTFTSGLTIKSGVVKGQTSANAFGAGSIYLGYDDGLNKNATVYIDSTITAANPIVLASNTTGTLALSSGGYAAVYSGGITGNNNFTVNNSSGGITLSGGQINNAGTVTYSGTSGNALTISSAIGSKVTGIIENSTNSALNVSGAITLGAGGLTLTNSNSSGSSLFTVSGGITGNGNLVINNNSSIANGITLSGTAINNTGTITNSGTGTGVASISAAIGSNVTGIIENSTNSALNVSGAITLGAGGLTLTNSNSSGSSLFTVSGGITGNGNLVINNNSSIANGITLSGTAINNAGTITNSGTGTGGVTISGGVGSNVTSITESSGTSTLSITGALAVNGSGTTLIDSSGAASFSLTGGISGNGNLALNNNSNTNGNITIFGADVNNVGTVTNSGTGTGKSLISANIGSNVTGVTENSATSGLTLSGTGTYNGPTLVNAGTLTVGVNNALSSSSAVTVASGATLDLHGYNDTVASIADSGTVTFGSGNTLTTTGSQTYTGTVTGSNITLSSGGTISANNALNNLTGNVTITASGAASIKNSGSLSLGAVSAGTFFGQALGGNLTLSAPVVVTGTSSNALVLVTNANFINNAGSNALQTGVGGNWLVYSTDPTDDTVSGNIAGGLANDYRRFSCTYGGSCPALGTGNGLLYSYTPNLTATASGITLTYGDAAPNLTGYNYTLSGYLGSDSGADHVTGSVNGTTNYTSTSNVGSYGITYANGALTSSMGYNIVVAPTNNTAITVNKAHLTVTANNQSRSYGSADPSFTDTITGFLNGQNIGVVSGSAGNSTPGTDTATSAAGNTYAITASLGSLSATNYDFTVFNPGTLTITKANLTITANGGVNQTYGSVNLGTTGFTTSPLQNGETVGAVTLTAVDTHGNGVSGSGNFNVGNYNIQGSAATGGTFNTNNYNITYTAATNGLTVTQKALTVAGLTAASRSYTGLTDETLGGAATLSGLVSGSDNVTLGGSATGTFANANVGTSKVVTIAGNTISGTDTGNYSFTQQAPLTADITKASLTITANGGVNQTYGSISLGTTGFTSMGLQNGETVGAVTLSAVDVHNNGTSTSGNLNVGNYNIQGSAATGGTFNTNNYAITYTAAANGLTVTQKALTVSNLAVNDKTYDSTTGATISNYGSLASGGVVGSDNVVLNHAGVTATFDNANAGTTHTVTTSGYALNSGNGNGDASNYSLTQPATGANVTINKASLTITSANQNQTYGFGGNSAALNGGSYGVAGTLYGTDSVTGVTFLTNDTTSSSGNYKAGTYTLTASNAAGSGLSNYNIAYTTNNTGLLVNQAVLTVTGLALNAKTYDSSTDATSSISNYGSLAAGVIGADSVSLNHSAVTATFDNANASTTHVVSTAGYALNSGNGNGDASNYIITQPVTAANVTINPAALTVTADNRTKGYGDTDPTFTYTTNGLKGSDSSASVLSGGLTRDAGENVGNYNITQGALSANSNYTLTYVPGTLAITTAHIAAVIADNQTMTYGSAAPLLTYNFSGLVNGDNVSVFTGGLATTATSSSNVGTYAITLGTLSAGANYTIDFTGGHVSVTPATLTVAASAGQHKTYGAVDPTLTYSYNGLVNGDQSTIITGGLTRAAGEAVANGPYAINLGTLSAGGNYTINYTGSTFAINAANLTITATGGVSQTYGSVNLGTTGFTTNGLQNGENIGAVTLTAVDTHSNGVSGSGNFNVGNYNIQGSAATGGSFTASNYNITYAAATDGLTVTQKALTVSGLTATSRSYNGLTSDALGGTAALSGLVSNNDHVTLGGTAVGTFANANAAFGKTVTISGNTISGSDIGNYSFTQEAPLTTDITKANLTITANGGVSQTYGSVNLGTTGFTSVGLQNGESIGGVTLAAVDTHANGVSSSNNLNVGSYTIAASNASGGTFSNANYNIGYTSATDGLSVTKKALTVSGVAVTGKTYDGNTDDTSGITSYGNLTGGGVIGIDSVNLNHNAAIATFDNANAGNNHNVTVTGYTLTSTDAGNYSVTAPIASNVVITPKALTVSANNISVNYGSIDPALTYNYNGLVGGDTSANFTGALARVAGSNAGNYNILQNTLAATGNYTIGSYTSGVFTITGVGAPVTTNNIIIPDTVTAESQKPVITTVNFNPLLNHDKPTIVLASSPTGNGKVYTPINSDISVDILPSLSPSVGNNKKRKETNDENCNIKVNGKSGASGAGCSTSIE